MSTRIFKSSNFNQSINFFKSSNYQEPISLAMGPPIAPTPFYIGRLFTFNSPGNYIAGFTGNIQVVVVGGGGGAGPACGGGGGGVTYCTAVPVIYGNPYTVTVGDGGTPGNPGTAGSPSSFIGTNVNLTSIGGGGGGPVGGGAGSAGANSGQPIQPQTPPVNSGTTFIFGNIAFSTGGAGAGGRSINSLGGIGVTLPANFNSITIGGGGNGTPNAPGGGGAAPGGGGPGFSAGTANTGGGAGGGAQAAYKGGSGVVLVYDGINAATAIPSPPQGTQSLNPSFFAASASATQTYTFNPQYTGNIQVLVAGGGGSGGFKIPGNNLIAGGGGGSGGGVICTSYPIVYGVPIQFTVGTAASDSTFGLITAFKGGDGGGGGGGARGLPGGSSGGSRSNGTSSLISPFPNTQGSAPGLPVPSITLFGNSGGSCPAAVSLSGATTAVAGAGGGGWAVIAGTDAPTGASGGGGGNGVAVPATFGSGTYGAGGAGGGTGNTPIAPVTVIASGGNGCPAQFPTIFGGTGSAGDVRIYS